MNFLTALAKCVYDLGIKAGKAYPIKADNICIKPSAPKGMTIKLSVMIIFNFSSTSTRLKDESI